jgi:hypothetical protein
VTNGVVPLESQENPAIRLFHGKAAPVSPHCRIGKVRRKWPDNVVHWEGDTSLQMEPAKLLAFAAEENLSDVIVLGLKNGEAYFAISCDETDRALVLSLRFAFQMLKLMDQVEGR